MALAVGETIDRYTVEGLCGEGGMGEVYAALDTRLRRRVALKVLRANDARPDAVARIFREARAAAALSHPNTVAIHDLIETGTSVTIVMELVSGKPLREYIGDPKVPMIRRVEWLAAMARALGAAHRAGIIHRDIKAPNVMITDEGAVKVLDFGLARPTDPMSFRTQRGYVLGTPKYMAPEQFEGRDVDARSDQYSFGVVAFELLCGQHPGLPGEAKRALDGVSFSLAAVIMRTLEMEPAKRYETMDDVAVALEDRTIDEAPSTAPAQDLATTDLDQRVPSGFAVRLATLERGRPHMATLTSRQVPTGMNLPRPAPAPALVPTPALEATLKSGEDADSIRAVIATELERRRAAKATSTVAKTEPMMPPLAREAAPAVSISKSSLGPMFVAVGVALLLGLASVVWLVRKKGEPEPTIAPPQEPVATVAPPAASPPPTPVLPEPTPTALPSATVAKPGPRPKPAGATTPATTRAHPPDDLDPWTHKPLGF